VLVDRQRFRTVTGDGDVVLLLGKLLKSAVAVPLHILMVHSGDVSEYSLFVCREADGDECGCEHGGATLHCVARPRVHVEDLGVQLVVVHLEVHAEGSCQGAWMYVIRSIHVVLAPCNE